MDTFIMGCLAACIIFFLLMITVHVVKMEKRIVNAVNLIEVKISNLFKK